MTRNIRANAGREAGILLGLGASALTAARTAAGKAAFRDIVQGNNGSFVASTGWDACTGLGSPGAPRVISVVKPGSSVPKSKPAAGKKTRASR